MRGLLEKAKKVLRSMDELKTLKSKINKIEKDNEANYHRLQLMLWYVIEQLTEAESIKDGKKEFFRAMETAEGGLRQIQKAGAILLENLDRICRENDIEYWLSFGTLLGAVRHKGFIPWDDDTDIGMTRENAERFAEIMRSGQYKDFKLIEAFVLKDPPSRMNHQYQFYFADSKNTASYNIDIFVYEWSEYPGSEVESKLSAIKAKMAEEVVAQIDPKEYSDGKLSKRPPYDDTVCRKAFEEAVKAERAVLGDGRSHQYLVWAIDNLYSGYAPKSSAFCQDFFPLEEVEFEGKKYPAPKNSEAYLNSIYGDIYSLPSDILTHSHTDYNKFTDVQKIVLKKIVDASE